MLDLPYPFYHGWTICHIERRTRDMWHAATVHLQGQIYVETRFLEKQNQGTNPDSNKN